MFSMNEDLKETAKALFAIMADPEITEAIADMCWNLYVKLKEKGFTDDQALQIVAKMSGNTGK